MKYKKLKVAVILIGSGVAGLQGQEVMPAAAGTATGSSGSVTYSVGQVHYNTHTGAGFSVALGVQQPFEISVVTGKANQRGIDLALSAYPNPATDHLTLCIESPGFSHMNYHLYDSKGILLESKRVEDKLTNIVMSHRPPSLYLISVTKGDKEIKTFKIQKH